MSLFYSAGLGGSAIPDEGNLHSRIDARDLALSDGDSVSASDVSDLANGSNSVSVNGSPTYRSAANSTLGVPSIEFDGSDDSIEISFDSSISDPYSVYWLGTLLNASTSSVVWGPNPATGLFGPGPDGGGTWQWRLNGTSDRSLGASTDTNGHVYGSVLSESAGTWRKDGSQVGSADPDASGPDGLYVAQQEGDNFANMQLSEILVYAVDENAAGNESEIEAYVDRDTSQL